MTGYRPPSNAARRSSCVKTWSVVAMPQRIASSMPHFSGGALPTPRLGPASVRRDSCQLRRLSRELFVDDALEGLERLGPAQDPAVDEKRRRTGHARCFTSFQVRFDVGGEPVGVEAFAEPGGIEANRRGVLLQIAVGELALVFEEVIVVLPELA